MSSSTEEDAEDPPNQDCILVTEDQYTAIASLKRDHRFAGAAISFPSWEKLVGENSEFVWAIYGGWLGSLRFGFAANSVRNGDSLYIKILEIFERLTLHLPRCGDKKGRKMPVTHMKFCHIRDGWFELSLVHTSTERRAKSLVSEEVKCERAGMKLVQEAAATTRTADPIPNSFDEWFPCTWTACVLSNCLQKKGADMLKDEPEPPKVYQLEGYRKEMKCTVAHTAHQLKQEGTAVQWSELGLGSNEKMKKLAYNSGVLLDNHIEKYIKGWCRGSKVKPHPP